MQTITPTSKDIEAWKTLPMTIYVFGKLQERIHEIQSLLGTGSTLNTSSATETLSNTAKEVGKIEGIEEIFGIEE